MSWIGLYASNKMLNITSTSFKCAQAEISFESYGKWQDFHQITTPKYVCSSQSYSLKAYPFSVALQWQGFSCDYGLHFGSVWAKYQEIKICISELSSCEHFGRLSSPFIRLPLQDFEDLNVSLGKKKKKGITKLKPKSMYSMKTVIFHLAFVMHF